MSRSKQDQKEEQQRVGRVIREIEQRITSFQQQAHQVKKEIVNIRRNFWEDVRVNFDDPGEAAETAISIKQQAEVLSDRERNHQTGPEPTDNADPAQGVSLVRTDRL